MFSNGLSSGFSLIFLIVCYPYSYTLHQPLSLPQVLRNLQHSMFHQVGARFIQHYNRKFGLAAPWGREWEQSSMAYLHYLMVVQSYNAYHPKFSRSFPLELQEQCMDRISFNVATPNIIMDDRIQWPDGINLMAGLTPRQPPAGDYQMVRLHQRQEIRQVTYFCSNFC